MHQTLYMFTSGAYSDYGVYNHLEGPVDFDIEPHLARAVSEMSVEWKAYQARRDAETSPYCPGVEWGNRRREWEAENPSPGSTFNRLLMFLEPFGFRERQVIEVHDYEVEKGYSNG